MVIVIKTSLAEAKAHLSELVDQPEHKKKRIVILRHGKPAAAIVPVEVAAPRKRRATGMNSLTKSSRMNTPFTTALGRDAVRIARADLPPAQAR
jgi:prevent-host-death family protein